jgi:hypothetical protein
MKKRCNLIKVAGGYTTEEYLRYRQIMDERDRRKRLDALTILNTLGQQFKNNDYSMSFHYHDYP